MNKISINLLTALLSLVIMSALLEGGARFLGYLPGTEYEMQKDSPDYLKEILLFSWQSNPYPKEGFCINPPVDPEKEKIFIFGGSSVGESGVVDISDTFPKKIEQELDAFQVINRGKEGKDSFYIKECIKQSIKHKPKYIIIYAGHNDFLNVNIKNPISLSLKKNPFALTTLLWLYDHSSFVTLYSKTLHPISNSSKGRSFNYLTFNQNVDAITTSFTENIMESIEIAQERGAKIILITVVSNLYEYRHIGSENFEEGFNSSKWFDKGLINWEENKFRDATRSFLNAKDYDLTISRAPSKLNDKIRKLAKENDAVYLIDFERWLMQYAANRSEPIGCNYFGRGNTCDSIHPNKEIHTLLSRHISDLIQELEIQE